MSIYKYNAGFTSMKGFVMPHNEGVSHLGYGRPTGFEAYFHWASTGKHIWQHRYNLPDLGVSLTYFDTDMVETGRILYLMTYMELFLKKSRFYDVYFRLGTGLTFSNTLYSPETNNLNVMLSSPVSYNMQGRLGLRIPVHPRWYLNTGITLSHASNGAVILPNSGINIVTANVGLGYRFSKTRLQPRPENPELDTSLGYSVLVSGTVRDPLLSQGRVYPFFTLRLQLDKTIGQVSRLTGGFDFFFNQARKVQIERNPDVSNSTDHKRIAIVIGHELLVSKMSLVTQAGRYIYQPFRNIDPNWYQRYGLKYYFPYEIFGTMMLKAHGGRADNFALGIGKRF